MHPLKSLIFFQNDAKIAESNWKQWHLQWHLPTHVALFTLLLEFGPATWRASSTAPAAKAKANPDKA